MASIMREWGIEWSEVMAAYEVFMNDLKSEQL